MHVGPAGRRLHRDPGPAVGPGPPGRPRLGRGRVAAQDPLARPRRRRARPTCWRSPNPQRGVLASACDFYVLSGRGTVGGRPYGPGTFVFAPALSEVVWEPGAGRTVLFAGHHGAPGRHRRSARRRPTRTVPPAPAGRRPAARPRGVGLDELARRRGPARGRRDPVAAPGRQRHRLPRRHAPGVRRPARGDAPRLRGVVQGGAATCCSAVAAWSDRAGTSSAAPGRGTDRSTATPATCR